MQKDDGAKDFLPDEQNADKVSDYPAVLVIYSAIATAALVFLLWVFPNPFVMLLPFFVPKLILAILKKESPPACGIQKLSDSSFCSHFLSVRLFRRSFLRAQQMRLLVCVTPFCVLIQCWEFLCFSDFQCRVIGLYLLLCYI